MANSDHVINHCGFTAEIKKAGIDKFRFRELVVERAGQIIASVTSGKESKPHKLAGVEIAAFAVAMHVISQGALQIARDLGTDLGDLKALASSQHISSC
jgi:hypothetical protein